MYYIYSELYPIEDWDENEYFETFLVPLLVDIRETIDKALVCRTQENIRQVVNLVKELEIWMK